MAEPANKLVKSGSIWDNDLPAGDSPPLPKWPLVFWGAVYVAWMIFLICMYVNRIQYTG